MAVVRTGKRLSRLSALSQIALLNTMGGFLAALCFFLMLPTSATPAPEGEDESSRPLPSLILSQPSPDEGPIPEGMLPVSSISISGASGGYEGANGVYYQNLSGLEIDYNTLLENLPSLGAPAEGPQVLILHTHTTEAYSDGASYYDPDASTYDQDDKNNVVAVGDTLAAALERLGVCVIHDTTHCDTPSFNQAYNKSRTVAEEVLAENPSIHIIVDLHRDSMISAQGVKYRPLLTVDGVSAAQLMLVVGSPKNGLEHPNWRENLALAARLYQILEQTTPGLMRPIHISANRYNQHLLPGAMLVEVGTCANTQAQADASVELLAAGIAQLLQERSS